MIKKRFLGCLILSIIILTLTSRFLFAQPVLFEPRENAIFTAMNEFQDRQDALTQSMQEAQMRLLEESSMQEQEQEKEKAVTRPRGFGFILPDLKKRIHPYLSTQMSFDDNIDSVGFGVRKKTAMTYTGKTGLQMNFAGRGKSLNIDMYANDVYQNIRSRNAYQDATSSITTGFSLGRYVFSLADAYYTNYIASKSLGMKDRNFQKYWGNTVTTQLGSHFNRIGFDIGASRAEYDYEPDYALGNDRYSEQYTFNQYLRLATRTRVSLGYTQGRIKYDHGMSRLDSSSKSFSFGVTGVNSPKITTALDANYTFGDPKVGDSSRDKTFGADIGYRLSGRTDMAFSFGHAVHDVNTKTDYYVQESINLSGNYRPAFNTKLRFSPSYSVSLKNYPKQTADALEENTYTVGLGLTYFFRRWLDLSLNFSNSKDVNNSGSEHRNNAVSLKADAKF